MTHALLLYQDQNFKSYLATSTTFISDENILKIPKNLLFLKSKQTAVKK